MNAHLDDLRELRHIETWRLVILTIATIGLYLAFYIRRQSGLINRAAGEAQRIAGWITLLPQLLALLSITTFIAAIASHSETIEHLDSAAGLLFNLSLVIWGFTARASMHAITGATEGSKLHLDWILTLIISPFYFNYRINEIFEPAAVQA